MTNEEKIRDILNRHYGYEVMADSDLWFTQQYQDRFAHLLEMAEWKDMEFSWQEIPKDKDGFYDDLKKNLYNELPIIVCCNQDGMYPILEYIDKDNWGDAVSDLSKPNYHYYMKVQPLKAMEE